MKNIRKNKTNQSVVWPNTTYFTIPELLKLNSKFVEITLRVRLSKAIEENKIAEIGAIPGGKGRPQKVFSMTPITQLVLDKARANSINLVDNASKLVNVMSLNNRPAPTVNPATNPSVKTTVP